MDLKLKGKLAIVTGATSGIGKAAAAELLKEGARVVITGQRAQKLVDEVTAELSVLGEVHGISADISKPEGTGAIIKFTDKLGEADILVNNAGLIYHNLNFEDITEREWSDMLNTNIMGAVRLCQHYLPRMLKRNYGRIIVVSSEVGLKPVGDRVHYSVSKTALIGLARAMAELTKGTKVTVNSILPGPTLTEGAIEAHKVRGGLLGISWEESIATTFDEDEPTSLVRRFTDPGEIATTIAYYCSELSAATNGAKILCEGGIVRHI